MNGIKTIAHEERNFQILVASGVVAILSGILLGISREEMMFVIIACVFVLGSEAINTAIEDLCDKIEPKSDPAIGRIKDIAVSFVLISSIGAVVIGLIVFLPYL